MILTPKAEGHSGSCVPQILGAEDAADGAALLGGPEAAVDIEGDLREPAAESRSQLVAGLGSVEPLAALRTEEYTVGAQSGSATR